MSWLSDLRSLRSNALQSWIEALDKALESWNDLSEQDKTKQRHDQIVDGVVNHYYIRGLPDTQQISRSHIRPAVPANPLKRKLINECECECVEIPENRTDSQGPPKRRKLDHDAADPSSARELSYPWAATARPFYAEPEDTDAWKTAQKKLRRLINIRRPIETAQHRALFRLMKENKRQVILLQWARSFNLRQTYQIPSTIKINLDYIIDQVSNGQLTKNWQKHAVLRQAWESLCRFLDGTTCQDLRDPSFLDDGAALTRTVLRLSKECYHNGMGFLSLPWSSVTRFFGLLKAARTSNQDLDSDNLVDDTTAPLDPDHGNLVQEMTTSLAEIQWYNFMPHMTAVPAGVKNLQLVVSREPLNPVPVPFIPSANPKDLSPVDDPELKDIFLTMRKEEVEISWQRTKDAETLQDSDTYLIQSKITIPNPDNNWKSDETLTKPLGPFTVSEAGPTKQVFINQCLTALRTIKDYKTIGVGNLQSAPHSLAFQSLCRGLYTLLKFQTPPEVFVGIANAIVPFDELKSLVCDAAEEVIKSSPIRGSAEAVLAAIEILRIEDYVIDILTDAQFSASNWPAPQLKKAPSGTWFAEKSSTQGSVDEIASSSSEDGEDESDSEDKEKSEGGVAIEPHRNGDAEPDSVDPKDVSIVIKPIPRAPYPANLSVVCKLWSDGHKHYLRLRKDPLIKNIKECDDEWMRNCAFPENCRNRVCKQLHPDIPNLPGLCRDWLRNKCNDVDCLMAHDDPLYPRNMHLAHLEPKYHPKQKSVCKFWQRDQCSRSSTCTNLHFIPNGQSKLLCEFYQESGCLNLDDRCSNLHVRGAPWPIPLYSSDYIDPEAPEGQPDRRPLSHAQRSEGGKVKVLCLNMAQTGTCWRKDKCWLEHNVKGAELSWTKDPEKKIPDSLTVTTGQRVTAKERKPTDESDICQHYLKFGQCRFLNSFNGCRHAIHTRVDPSEKARSQTGSRKSSIIGNAAQHESKLKPMTSAIPAKSKTAANTAPVAGGSKTGIAQRSNGDAVVKKEAGAVATPASNSSGSKAPPEADNSAPMVPQNPMMNSFPPQMFPYGPGSFANSMGFNPGQQFNVPYNQFAAPGNFMPAMPNNQMNFPGNFGQNMPPNQFGPPGNFGMNMLPNQSGYPGNMGMNMPGNHFGPSGNFGGNMPAPSMGRQPTRAANAGEFVCHYCGGVGHKKPHCYKMELDRKAGKPMNSNHRGLSSRALAQTPRDSQQSNSASAYAQNLSGFQVPNNGHGQNSHQGPTIEQNRPGQMGNKRRADDDEYAQPDRQNGKRKIVNTRNPDEQGSKRNRVEGGFQGNRVAKRKVSDDDEAEGRAAEEVKRNKLDTGREERPILPPRGPRATTGRPPQMPRPPQPRQPSRPPRPLQNPNGELHIRGAAGNQGGQQSNEQRGRGQDNRRRQGPPPGGRRPAWR